MARSVGLWIFDTKTIACAVRRQHRRLVLVGDGQLGRDPLVVPPDALHEEPQNDHRNDRDPRPSGELRDEYDHEHGAGQEEREAADEPAPMRCATLGGSVCARSKRFQCRTMPPWLQVNETKTPTM